MKKPVRSPRKLVIDKTPLQPLLPDQLEQVDGGNEYKNVVPYKHPKRRVEY